MSFSFFEKHQNAYFVAMKKAFYFITSLLFVLLLSGCETVKKEQPVTAEEAVAFARRIEAGISKGDENIINKVLDVDLFAAKVAVAANQKGNKSLMKGVKAGLQKQNLSKQLLGSLEQDGTSYQYVKQYEKDGHQHVIFRLFGDDGINYHDYEVVKIDNAVKATDIYVYLSGENLSQSMGQIMTTVMGYTNGDKTTDGYINTLLQLRQLSQAGKFAEAKKIFDGLPPQIRKERVFQILNTQISSNLDNDAYVEALREFEAAYGNDPSAQLLLFDGYFLRGEYDKSLQVLDNIDKVVNDPVLDYYRALLYNQKKNVAKGTEYLEKLHKRMPAFENGTLELLATYAEAGEWQKAQALVDEYKQSASFNEEKIKGILDLYPKAKKELRL